MKKSKINPLEAHFEKLILVVVSGVLLAVVAMQFLTQPNAVQVGSNPTPLAPDRVFDPIEADAEALLARMRDVNPMLPEVPEQDVAGQFARVSNLSIADSIQITMMGEGVNIGEHDIGSAGSDAATTYAMPALPVPAALAVATHRATIDPYEAITNDALRAYLPQEQPFDTVAVSVEGTISGASLLASLEEDPDGEAGPMRPLPLQWWRGNLELLGVEVEREELGPDGSWGGMTVLSGVPGRDTLLSEARQEGITPAELVQVARSAEEFMRDIAQPSFPQTIAGPEWVRPSEMSAEDGLSDEDREIAMLERRYASFEKRRDGLMLQLESVGAGGGGSEDRGGERNRGGGGEGGRPGTTRTPVDRDQQKRDILQSQIDAAERQMERLADQLAELGAPVDQDQAQDSQPNEPEPPLPALLEAEDLPVWVHDFGAEPGKMYRYRMRVVVNNPLFAKEQYLSEAQQASAGSPTVEGAWSAWSSPITVEQDRHFFVVSGSESDAIGNGPRAAVEVYQFYYGYWRKGSTTLEPGDLIHARAKLPDNLLLWDLAKLEEMGPQSGVRGLAGGRQDFGRDPEGERDRREFVEGNPDRPVRTQREPSGSRDARDADLPDGAERAPDTLDLVLSAILLDVMPTPGDKDSTRVVLRDPEGRLVTRLTAADRSSQLYKRLVSNAREGETQGQPKIDPNENRPNVPIPGERRREFEGEGGGAGGGG